MKLLASIAILLLVELAPGVNALEECQITEDTIKSTSCFIGGQCYVEGDKRTTVNGVTGISTISQCQTCTPSLHQTVWSVLPGFVASTLDPPSDCSAIPTDTYQSCSTPSFEWLTMSRKTTAGSKAFKGGIDGNNLFIVAHLKAAIDTEDQMVNTTNYDYVIRGPYSTTDPKGDNAKELTVPLTPYSPTQGARENSGGSFGQYDIGVIKVDISTGNPIDVFQYVGNGFDQPVDIVAQDGNFVVCGHFTGNLTVPMLDANGVMAEKTIRNSNLAGSELPDNNNQYHPNTRDSAGETGEDDGFIIKANGDTGVASWIVHYPQSNKDAEIVSIDMDKAGDVYAAGYTCSQQANSNGLKVCDGIVAKFSGADGMLIWEKKYIDLGGVIEIVYDEVDNSLYYSASTTYAGSAKDVAAHKYCTNENGCAIIGRLSAADGSSDWMRSVHGSPRLSSLDQSGDIELAPEDTDGPYVYVALDDVGEASGPVDLDNGSPYAACMDDNTNVMTPEYEISLTKRVLASDCPVNTTFVDRNDDDSNAFMAAMANTKTYCGESNTNDACLMKFHKYSGLPMWGKDVPPLVAIVPSADGKSIMTAGAYNSKSGYMFDSVELPGYVREGGLASQTVGMYNAQLSSSDGTGEFALHMGGGSKDKVYDIVADNAGNIYNIGFSTSLTMNWGGLTTYMTEVDVAPEDVRSQSNGDHLYVAKLGGATSTTPSCLSTCTDTTATATVDSNSCFIDSVCYAAGDTSEMFGTGPCYKCDPAVSQREWSEDSTVVGQTHCFIYDICVPRGDSLFSQRRTWGPKTFSKCQLCDPTQAAYAYVVNDKGFTAIEGGSIPKDCEVVTEVPTPLPSYNPTNSPVKNTKNPTNSPVKNPTKNPTNSPVKNPTNSPSITQTTSPPSAETTVKVPDTSSGTYSSPGKMYSRVYAAGVVIWLAVFIL